MIPVGIFSQSASSEVFNVLFVIEDKTSPTTAEANIKSRLESNHSCNVTYISDEDPEPSASLYDFAIIGDVDTLVLGTKYKDIVLNWMLFKGSSHDELNVSASNGTTRTGVTALDIQNTSNYLTSHFSGTGDQTIGTPQRMSCNGFTVSTPSGAVVVAKLPASILTPNDALFYIKQGNSLISGTAPALRIAAPFYDDGVDNLNADGLLLFDKCIDALKDPSLLD